MSSDIEEGADGKLYIRETVMVEYHEAKKLYDLDCRELLNKDVWELYAAICYLTGFDYFDDSYHFATEINEMKEAFSRIKVLYPIFLKFIEQGSLFVQGSISNYLKSNPTIFINSCQLNCYVKPCDFLECAIVNDILLPLYMRVQTHLYQQVEMDFCAGQKQPNFTSGDKPTIFNVRDEARLACRAGAHVLWHFNNGLSKAAVRKILEKGRFLKKSCNFPYDIPKENAFNRWITELDPTGVSSQRGRRRREGNSGSMDIGWFKLVDAVYLEDVGEGEYYEYIPVSNFRKLRVVLRAFVQTLLYKSPDLTCDSIFSHPVINSYTCCFRGIAKEITSKWIQEALSEVNHTAPFQFK